VEPSTQTLVRRRGLLAVLTALCATAALLLLPAVAGASSTFTWNGTRSAWAEGAAWEGGIAPSGTVGTLTFPSAALNFPGAACTTSPFTSCPAANNISGLTVGTLEMGEGYELSGDGITLGAGGLSVSQSSPDNGDTVRLPITLGAAQTWNLTGHGGVWGGFPSLDLTEPLTGTGDALTIAINNGGILDLEGNNEVGPITITSSGTKTGQSAYENGDVYLLSQSPDANLNAADGNTVSLTNTGLDLTAETVGLGPLTSTNSDLSIGNGGENKTTMLDARSATFNSTSAITSLINETGVSQLISTGPITLGGAWFTLPVSPDVTSCSTLAQLGKTYTLISTSGTLSGTLSNVSEGIPLYAFTSGPDTQPQICENELQISYHNSGTPQTVTGTVIKTPPSEDVTTTLEVSNTTPAIGETVTYTATATPATTGPYLPSDMSFYESNGPISGCSDVSTTPGTTSSTATCQTSYTEAGSHSITALGGGIHFSGGMSIPQTVTVHATKKQEEEAAKKKEEEQAATKKHEEEVAAQKKKEEEDKNTGNGSGGGSTTPSTTSTTSTTMTTPATTAATGSVSLDGSDITVTSSGKATIKLTCTGTATCGGKLTLTAKTKGKKKATTKTIGTSSFSIPAGKTATVTLALTATGRALLSAAHGKLTTTLVILKSSPGPSNTQTHSVHLAQHNANGKKAKR
jgi:hypothetical protein